MRYRVILIGTLATLLFFYAFSFSNDTHMTPQQKAATFLNSIVEDSSSPGVQYVFVSPENILFHYSNGTADIHTCIPVSNGTTFNAYSVTKTFTALAILQLAEQGKLKLNDSISNYVSFYPYSQSPTIQQTLSHIAGFPNPIPLKWIHLQEEHESFDEAEFIEKVLEENNKLDNEPGKKFAYSNIGYLLLGEVIKRVSDQSYQEYIRRNIIDRVRLNHEAKLDFAIPSPESHAKGYIRRWSFMSLVLGFMIDKDRYTENYGGRWIQFKNLYVNGSAYGGIIGNAAGFGNYLQALLKTSVLISDEYKSKLFTRQRTNDGRETKICLSWFVGNVNGETYFAHAGGGGGYYCEIRMYPKLNRASVIMFNRTGLSDERFLDRIDTFLLKI